MKTRKTSPADYRAHVFTATGDITDVKRFGIIDFFDNAVIEIDRLSAIAELLDLIGSRDENRVLLGASSLIAGVQARLDILVRTLGRMENPTTPRSRRKL